MYSNRSSSQPNKSSVISEANSVDQSNSSLPSITTLTKNTEDSQTPLDDNAKKAEFKNLIKEKVLKPSKLPEFDLIRGHHSHLVIRDSHYLIKAPTSFITCSACHRGRVLKISTIKENLTNDILNEIYLAIAKSPCSKKKGKETLPGKGSKTLTPSTNVAGFSINKNNEMDTTESAHKKRKISHNDNFYNNSNIGTPNDNDKNNLNTSNKNDNKNKNININNNDSNVSQAIPAPPYQNQQAGSSFNTCPQQSMLSSQQLQNVNNVPPNFNNHNYYSVTPKNHPNIPTFEQFFDDWDEIVELPPLDETLQVKSLNTSIKISNYTLTSLFNQHTKFPTTLDFFLSLSIEKEYGDSFFTKDTLIVPFPTYSCTSFMKDFNKDLFFKDDHIKTVILDRMTSFINQPSFNVNNFKIIILFNFFQEGVPERPQEHQAHKYVGNVYTLSDFHVDMADNSLGYQISRITFNHNYTMIDQKEEWFKTEVFNELIINPLQKAIFTKFGEYLLGSYVNVSVLERGPMMTFLPYTVESGYIVTSASSMLVVNFINLKILRILLNDNGLQMLGYLVSIKVNTKHNLYILRLLLDLLHKNYFNQHQFQDKQRSHSLLQHQPHLQTPTSQQHSQHQQHIFPIQQLQQPHVQQEIPHQLSLHQQIMGNGQNDLQRVFSSWH